MKEKRKEGHTHTAHLHSQKHTYTHTHKLTFKVADTASSVSHFVSCPKV